MTWDGVERRKVERRAEHCEHHEVNSKEISGLKSRFAIGQWILGLLVVILMAMIGTMNGKLDSLQTFVNSSTADRASLREKVVGMEETIKQIQQRLYELRDVRNFNGR